MDQNCDVVTQCGESEQTPMKDGSTTQTTQETPKGINTQDVVRE